MYKYRVFISYSHQDKDKVEKLARILEQNGLSPIYDRHLTGGFGFSEQIKKFISHAHVFMPLITASSSKRGWVHQEIGYAAALNIPILPIKIDDVPGQMIEQLQALSWDEDEEKLKEIVSYQRFENLVEDAQKDMSPLFECGELREDRTKLMIKYASDITKMGYSGHVRQKGALSSFHIPNKRLNDPVWNIRYGSYAPGEYRYRLLRMERQKLEKHARISGCSIIIDPYLSYKEFGLEATIVRLGELLEFLNSMPDDKVKVGIMDGLPRDDNLTIVGDWFAAESVSVTVGKGYRQTMFTRYGPFIHGRIEAFDEMLADLMKKQDPSLSSRAYTIKVIEERLVKLRGQKKEEQQRAKAENK